MKKKYIIEYSECSSTGMQIGHRNDKGRFTASFHYFDSYNKALDALYLCGGKSGHYQIKEVYV